MRKEKIRLEYLLNATSKTIIWNAISTPTGMENWFADQVKLKEKTFTFQWGKTEIREAEIVASRIHSFMRLHWLDEEEEEEKTFFEFKMTFNELTSDYVLEITDFIEPDEKQDQIELWNSQIDTLKRVCGM